MYLYYIFHFDKYTRDAALKQMQLFLIFLKIREFENLKRQNVLTELSFWKDRTVFFIAFQKAP